MWSVTHLARCVSWLNSRGFHLRWDGQRGTTHLCPNSLHICHSQFLLCHACFLTPQMTCWMVSAQGQLLRLTLLQQMHIHSAPRATLSERELTLSHLLGSSRQKLLACMQGRILAVAHQHVQQRSGAVCWSTELMPM
jgi:hypothetical protein